MRQHRLESMESIRTGKCELLESRIRNARGQNESRTGAGKILYYTDQDKQDAVTTGQIVRH